MRWTGAVASARRAGPAANADGAELALAALLAAAPADADGRVRELRVHALALAHDVRGAPASLARALEAGDAPRRAGRHVSTVTRAWFVLSGPHTRAGALSLD